MVGFGRRQRVGASGNEDLAILDVDNAVGIGFEPRVVGDDDDGRAERLGGALQELDHHLAVLAVERAGRLVGEQAACGSLASARAMATRCFSPPDISEGREFIRISRPTSVRALAAL